MHRLLRAISTVRSTMKQLKTASISPWRSAPLACQHCLPAAAVTSPANWRMHQLSELLHGTVLSINGRCQAARTAITQSAAAVPAYGAQQIQVLKGLDPVRKRPGMYIGSTGSRGLHHLLWEVLDNAVDEVQGGFADQVSVEVDLATHTVTVADNGRGIPTDIHPSTGKSALETVLTVLHAGGKFGAEAGASNGGPGSSGYRVSGGLHGVGISVVNALSEQLHVEVLRSGVLYRQSFSRGDATSPLTEQPAPPGSYSSGTKVTFQPDASVFAQGMSFDADTIVSRLRELSFLNAGATLRLKLLQHGLPLAAAGAGSKKVAAVAANGSNGQALAANGNGAAVNAVVAQPIGSSAVTEEGWQVFRAESGLKEYVQWVNRDNHVLHEPAVLSATAEGVEVSLALQWASDTFSDTLVGFANSIKTIDGGSHMDGLRAALTRLINNLAKKNKLLKDLDPSLSGDHIREGLAGVISVKVPSPEFEGQTKTRLGNPEVRRLVDSVVSDQLGTWLESHPAALQAVVAKALTAARAAEAARKARELVRRKHVLTRSTLPGKLADCTSNNREATEIFLVEGDSAGGSAKQARDRHTQAILPLRGKILNVERKDDAALYKNQEIASLIVALGLGTKGAAAGSKSKDSSNSNSRGSSRRGSSSVVEAGEQGAAEAELVAEHSGGSSSGSDPLKGLRYGKIVLLTDADVDGAHIRTLLLTFLFRYKRELFEAGRIYVAVPPLYRIELGRSHEPLWAYDDAGLKQLLQDIGSNRATIRQQQQQQPKAAADRRGRTSSSKACGTSDASAAADNDSSATAVAEAEAAAEGAGRASVSGTVGSLLLPPGVTVTRFKGLGEMMPEQLWSTTLNPDSRVLRRLTLEDAAEASHTFALLMGDKVAPRRALIEAEGQRYTLEQLDI